MEGTGFFQVEKSVPLPYPPVPLLFTMENFLISIVLLGEMAQLVCWHHFFTRYPARESLGNLQYKLLDQGKPQKTFLPLELIESEH
jgi:hypothetical protein